MCKKSVHIFFFVLVFALAGSASAGLVGYWSFDEGSGSTAKDGSGNNNHGALMGDPQWVAGQLSMALQFDGVDDWVEIPHADILTVDTEVTVAAWINAERHAGPGGAGWQGILAKGNANRSYSLYTVASNGVLHFSTAGVGTTSTAAVPLNEWVHVAAMVVAGGHQYYINGTLAGQAGSGITLPGTADTESVVIGTTHEGAREFLGMIDEVRIYDRALTEAEIKQLAFRPKAHNPSPPDGATGVTGPLLTWTAGDTATWHDIYLGTSPTPGAAEYKGRQPLAWAMWYEAAGWIPNQTYYWRIDEVEADGTTIYTGDVWSFTAAPLAAYDPEPPDSAKYVNPDADLSWTPGVTAFSHDVYFGTDETEVTNGTGGTFKANQTDAFYEPGTLAKDTRYYWRIDEVEQNNITKYTGDVWSFKTIPDIPVTNPDLVGWWRLDEGEGTTVIDWSGHDNYGSLIGDPQWVLGYDGGALELDGVGDYVEIPHHLSLTVDTEVAVMAWINTPRFEAPGAGYQGIIAKGNVPRSYSLYTTSGGVFHFSTTSAGAYVGSTSSTAVPLNEWVHVCAMVAGGAHRYYVNGEPAGEGGGGITLPGTADTASVIIGRTHEGGNDFLGMIDDVRVYAKALTQEEVKEAMQGDPTLARNPSPDNGSTPDIEGATPLSWSPGENAAKHDVYFGTDRDAVEDADTTTTGVYRGRQDPNTYAPPEGVQINKTYYWRIDEFNADATITKGRVWAFTVADYLIVDDLEPYDDYCNRIFYTWGDGWGHSGDVTCGVAAYSGNGTGSTIGYLMEPYAEQTIVNGGKQSMPFEYLNNGSTGKALYSETERTFATAQDWTRHDVKALTLWFRGYLASDGSFSYDPGTDVYTMTARSGDIWGQADEFHYAYKRLSGQGEIVARVLSVDNTAAWAKPGVMIRETLDPNSAYAFMFITPDGRRAFQNRPTRAGDAVSAHSATGAVSAPYWVRLVRQGNNFTAYHSTNGVDWEIQPDNENTGGDASPNPQNIPMGADVYVGLALCSNNTGAVCQAQFSDVTIIGTVTGQWQSQDIGVASNDAERLYVALEDNTGTVKDVPHPDPNAAQLDAWQQWNIDLAEFAPVDLTKVKKIYIGVGNRNTPALGGGGMLYIDDIRLYMPRCMPSQAKSAADFNSNCVVDYPDLKILTNDWLFAPGASGLNYECYEGDWDLLPDFDSLTPALVGKVDNFDISVRTQDEYFGFRFTGQINIATAGDYTFYTESDDGSRLYIDGTLVVDNDGLHGMVEQSGTISLTAGMHPTTATMFEKTGGEGLNVQYEGPGITKGPIPDNVLYRQSSLVDLSGDGAVDLRDYALLADVFLDEKLWP